MTKHRLTIPMRFYEDHVERDLPAGAIEKATSKHYTIVATDEELEELLSDARHYSDPGIASDLGTDYFGLVSSARATVRAIEKYLDSITPKIPEPVEHYWIVAHEDGTYSKAAY